MRATLSHASAFVVLLAGLASASARVTTVRIDRVEPFANGMSFGDSGAYERVIGIARGELDPADPRNRVIVGIDRAPRNAAGMVEYETDLFILRPVEPAKGNRQLLFDVVNRGNKVVTNALDRTVPADSTNDPSTVVQAGDGFLFRRGYTIAWAGWDPDFAEDERGHDYSRPRSGRRRTGDPRRVRLGDAWAGNGQLQAELYGRNPGYQGGPADDACSRRRSADAGACRRLALRRCACRPFCCRRAPSLRPA